MSDDIVILRDADAVRKRPGMYIGNTDDGSWQLTVLRELVSNAADQFLIGHATCCKVTTLGGQGFRVEDDGSGIPFDLPSEDPTCASLGMEVMARLHRTATADHHAPHVHLGVNSFSRHGSGLHGVGASAVLMLCCRAVVESWRDGALWRLEFELGRPVQNAQIVERGEGRGTKIDWFPDPELLNLERVREREELVALVRSMAPLVPGFILEYDEQRFEMSMGLLDMVCEDFAQHNFANACSMQGAMRPECARVVVVEHERYAAEVALLGDGRVDLRSRTSFVNGLETVEHGVHMDALEQALDEVGWSPNVACVHVVLLQPSYAAPVKARLLEPDITESLRDALVEQFRRIERGELHFEMRDERRGEA